MKGNKRSETESEENTSTTSDRSLKKHKYRKYDDSYLDFGFTSTEFRGEVRAQCVLCMKIFAPESMVPSKLKRHLQTSHATEVTKSRDYFARKLRELNQQKASFTKHASVPSNALLASYKVAHRIAKCKKPHTIAEELILPAAVDMVNIMIGESAGKLLSKVPLSNDTIRRRIQHIAEDLNEHLIDKMKGKEFGLQLDEATDNNNDAYLICYVRFMDSINIVEELLFCKSIINGAKAQDLFQILDSFIIQNNLDWAKCVGVCTDGARAMSGCYGGLQALIRRKAPDALWTHCIIHREALASKFLSPALNTVFEYVVNVVNFIKTRPLKARFFKKLCDEMGSQHSSLLYFSSSRWLSRGNVLSRTYELRQEIYIFLKEEDHKYADYFVNEDFLLKLAYLCDIFEKLNALNLSLQGRYMHILKGIEKISAFIKKLKLWKVEMNENGGKECFPILQHFLTSNGINFSYDIKSIFEEHLSQLVAGFEKYFRNDCMDKFSWIQDPFNVVAPSDFTIEEKENLIDLSCDNSLKNKFSAMELTEFWMSVGNEYSLLSVKAQKILIPFATSYLCEAGFSAVAVIKSKYRSKINVENEMRVAISNITPRFSKMCDDQQAHPSH